MRQAELAPSKEIQSGKKFACRSEFVFGFVWFCLSLERGAEKLLPPELGSNCMRFLFNLGTAWVISQLLWCAVVQLNKINTGVTCKTPSAKSFSKSLCGSKLPEGSHSSKACDRDPVHRPKRQACITFLLSSDLRENLTHGAQHMSFKNEEGACTSILPTSADCLSLYRICEGGGGYLAAPSHACRRPLIFMPSPGAHSTASVRIPRRTGQGRFLEESVGQFFAD